MMKKMNKDNISAIITAVAVISLITGFGIYFNFYSKYFSKLFTAKTIRKLQLIQSLNKKWRFVNLEVK